MSRRECANLDCRTLISDNANNRTRRCAKCVRLKHWNLDTCENDDVVKNLIADNKNRNWKKEPLQVLSFGGGVQSSAMLIMIKNGVLPRPDLVVHSDTGSEMPHTEKVLEWARLLCIALKLPYATVMSHRGRLHEDYLSTGTMPMVRHRSCTFNFKVQTQRKFFRRIVGKGNGKVMVQCWLGITTDEKQRRISVHDADVKWTGSTYPLLDMKPTSRRECENYIAKENLEFTIQKSGCFCCPYAKPQHFAKLYREHPDLFAICVEMEEQFNARWSKEGFGEKSLSPNLKSLKSVAMPSLENWGFEFELNPENECSSGHCFY